MPRVGKNPNWNRFNLIVKKVISVLNLPNVAQAELIAGFYDWIEPFAAIWKNEKDNEEYTSWLIYRGIGNSYSTSGGIDGIDYPHGLLNDPANRAKAAARIRANFGGNLTEEQVSYVNKQLIRYLKSEEKDGFVAAYVRRVPNVNALSLGTYVRAHLVPALERINEPYELLAGILIYAQSGCIPLDVHEPEKEQKRAIGEQGIREIYPSPEFHELDDPLFCGTFYGYFRQYHNESGESAYKGLVPFELTVEYSQEKGSSAVMTFQRFTPAMEAVPIRMTGKPMVGQQTVHIVLQAERGDDFVTMAYKWISLKSGGLQSRQGVLITMDRAERCPQVQQFIFFNQPIPKEKEKYVDAFLRFSGDRFILSQDAAAELSREEMRFLEKYGKPIEGFVISAKQAILSAQYDDINDHEIVRDLLSIKLQSLSPLIINARDEKQVSDFFRSMLTGNAPAPDFMQK